MRVAAETPQLRFHVDGVRVLIPHGTKAAVAARDLPHLLMELGARTCRMIPSYVGSVVSFGLGGTPNELFPQIADALKRAGARICYIEAGVDVLDMDAGVAESLIVPRLVIRGRSSVPVCTAEPGGATYMRRRGTTRNVAWYAGRPSKATPHGPNVFRFEVRLKNRTILRKGVLERPAALVRLADPRCVAEILDAHVRLCDVHFDPVKLEQLVKQYHTGAWTVPAEAAVVHHELGARAFDRALRPIPGTLREQLHAVLAGVHHSSAR